MSTGPRAPARPSARSFALLRGRRRDRWLPEDRLDLVVRARDDLHADDFPDVAGGLRPGVGGGLDRGDVTHHDGGDETVADLFHGTGERDVR